MNRKLLFGLAAGGLLTAGSLRHQANQRLEAEVAQLRRPGPAPGPAASPAVEGDITEGSAPAGPGPEDLARLRAESAGLQAAKSNLLAQTREEAAADQADIVSQKAVTEAFQKAWEEQAKTCELWVTAALAHAAAHPGRLPTDFAGWRQVLPPELAPATDEMAQRFEFVNRNAALPKEDPGHSIWLRQTKPLPTPGGTLWLRRYLMADGEVRTRSAADGNFQEWESAHQPPVANTAER